MENQPEASNMMMMFECMLQEQRAMSEIAASVERLVQRNGQFNVKDVSRYLRDYKAEMLRCGISEGLQVTFLQPGGYRRASSNYPWATTTKSDMGGV